MDLNLAKTLVVVAEMQSFTAAAKALGVPTSSVSRAVGRLEAELGAKLLERTTRRTMLTAAGRVFVEHARSAVEELAEGERRVSELVGEPRGEVRLTTPINLDDGFLADRLVAFGRRHPKVQLTVVPTNRAVDLIEERFDLALRAQMQMHASDSDLAARELGRFQVWLVAARSYVKRCGLPQRPQDLADHDCVGLRPRHGTSRWPLVGPRGVEVVEVGGPFAADDMLLAHQLVGRGAGIGFLVFAPGVRPVLGADLVRVLPDYQVQGMGLYLVTAPRKSLPLRVRLVREFLVEAYAGAAG